MEEENHSAHCQHVGQHWEENQSGRDEVVKQELVVFPISSPPDSHQLEYWKEVDSQLNHVVDLQILGRSLDRPVRVVYVLSVALPFSPEKTRKPRVHSEVGEGYISHHWVEDSVKAELSSQLHFIDSLISFEFRVEDGEDEIFNEVEVCILDSLDIIEITP